MSNRTPRHTILLFQFTSNLRDRGWRDFESVTAAMNGVCELYEQKLRQMNPTLPNITYGVDDLYRYIDQITDLSALVFDPATNQYAPHTKGWVKQRVLNHLQQQANPSQ